MSVTYISCVKTCATSYLFIINYLIYLYIQCFIYVSDLYILCENLCNILFIYNKLFNLFIYSVFYYHCEQLRAHRPDK